MLARDELGFMPAAVIQLKNTDDPRDAVHRAVETLAAGKIVAFPTETVYGIGASALIPEAVERLVEAKQRDQRPLALAIKSVDEAMDYIPNMPPLALRLARRCWPGPLTLVLRDSHPDSVISRLPESVQNRVLPNGTVGLRVPAHSVVLETLRLLAGPLVLTSANLSGDPDAKSGEEVIEALRDKVDLVLDDGPSRYGRPSSVVKVEGNEFTMLREGVVMKETLEQMTYFMALVVCTGNTCRSPMGELILRRAIAKRMGCQEDQLRENGVAVRSAGVAAMSGGRPSQQSCEVMKNMGMDLSEHASQPVTDRLVKQADLILTMTNGHRQALIAQWPDLANRTHLFSIDDRDVTDPIGQPEAVYQACADQLVTYADHWAEQILEQVQQGDKS